MELFWRLLAFVVSRRPVARWIIRRAQRTPYWHLKGYMNRWWFFNGYAHASGKRRKRFEWLPSIRVHQILRKDLGEPLHDHPWNARTMILEGYYTEVREKRNPRTSDGKFYRSRGGTARLNFGEFHKIVEVSPGGVWTLFICGPYRGTWGFLIDGNKVKHYDRPNEFN